MQPFPLLITFARGSTVTREPDFSPQLPILQNGPPGTFIHFANGDKVPLPTDQIVFTDDHSGAACVAFGGMDFGGIDNGQLVFHRVRDLAASDRLSPERGRRMTLEPFMVESISVDGERVWPTLH